MPRAGLLENREICATVIKKEPTEYSIESSPQILNLSSIYRQPLSATKDTQAYYQSYTVHQGGQTPRTICLSPIGLVGDVKPQFGKQVISGTLMQNYISWY